VNGRVFVIAFVGLGLVGTLVAINVTRPAPKRPEPVPTVARSEPPAAPKEERRPQPLPPKPAPRVARREPPAPAPSAPPAPAPAPANAAPETATLRINSDVPGAQVFIDRVFIGEAPATALNVKPGTHRLNVSAQGHDGVAETLEVSPGTRDILIKLKDVRLDAKLAVVHKHKIGSCRGQLIATPQGLRYETADKNDGFSVPLQSLEAFEVAYLEKQLRLKLQTGKQYEFTDPDGSADRLFVFHRDVEKARDRLKKGDPPAAP